MGNCFRACGIRPPRRRGLPALRRGAKHRQTGVRPTDTRAPAQTWGETLTAEDSGGDRAGSRGWSRRGGGCCGCWPEETAGTRCSPCGTRCTCRCAIVRCACSDWICSRCPSCRCLLCGFFVIGRPSRCCCAPCQPRPAAAAATTAVGGRVCRALARRWWLLRRRRSPVAICRGCTRGQSRSPAVANWCAPILILIIVVCCRTRTIIGDIALLRRRTYPLHWLRRPCIFSLICSRTATCSREPARSAGQSDQLRVQACFRLNSERTPPLNSRRGSAPP